VVLNLPINYHIEEFCLKRIIDIFLSSLILFMFLPIGLFILIILKFTGEGEVFYKQDRVGQYGKVFGIYKFVTMIKDSPNIGAGDITLKEDPRVLPFGKILRKLKLNEFPQFINVLIGNMSLVGPRPLVENQFDMISNGHSKETIKKMKPGITGIGSIIFRDEEKYLNNNKDNSQKFYQEQIVPFKTNLECWYFDKKSVIIDIFLIIITLICVIHPNTKIYQKIFPNLPKHPIFNPN